MHIRETVLDPNHVAVAADLAALAALVQEQQRFDEAEKLPTIAIFEAAHSNRPIETAQDLANRK